MKTFLGSRLLSCILKVEVITPWLSCVPVYYQHTLPWYMPNILGSPTPILKPSFSLAQKQSFPNPTRPRLILTLSTQKKTHHTVGHNLFSSWFLSPILKYGGHHPLAVLLAYRVLTHPTLIHAEHTRITTPVLKHSFFLLHRTLTLSPS